MKQLKMLALTVILSLSLFSCSDNNGPEVTAEKFITLTNEGKFAEAKKLGTEKTVSYLTMLEKMLGSQSTELEKQNKDLKIKIISTVEKDNTAKVIYKVEGGPEGKEQQLDLIKVGDEWKADIGMGI